jgi:hypothetical protein
LEDRVRLCVDRVVLDQDDAGQLACAAQVRFDYRLTSGRPTAVRRSGKCRLDRAGLLISPRRCTDCRPRRRGSVALVSRLSSARASRETVRLKRQPTCRPIRGNVACGICFGDVLHAALVSRLGRSLPRLPALKVTRSVPRGRLLEVLERKNIERRATTDTTTLRPRPGARAVSCRAVMR